MYKSPQIKEMFTGQVEAVKHLKKIIFGSDPNSRKKYIKDFTEEFSSFKKVSSFDDLVVNSYKADLIYIGDYHALKECQFFEAEFIKKIAKKTKQAILCLEMVYSRNQPLLNAWMRGEITEEEFLRRIRYDAEWGYEWEGFRGLFTTAMEFGISVFGIDSGPRGGFKYINKRDAFAAEKIVQLFQSFPDAKIFVIFGESHLAKNHLPRKVKERLKKANLEKREIVIVQNIDALYWERMRKGLEYADVVEVSPGRYCVFNSSLIAKYESYRQTLERWKNFDDEDVDLTPTLYNMIDTILKFLEIDKFSYVLKKDDGYKEYLVDVFPEVYSGSEKDFVKNLLLAKKYPKKEIDTIKDHIAKNGSCFVPGLNAIIIGKLDVRHGGEEAAHFINKALKGEIGLREEKPLLQFDRFYGAVIEEAIAFFGSKLIDPSRNHFFETEFYQLYGKKREEIERKSEYSYDEYSEIIHFILLHKRFEREYEQFKDVPPEILAGIKSDNRKFTILTHELGYFLGQQIFDAYQNGGIEKEEIQELFRKSYEESGSALETYLSLVNKAGKLFHT